MDKSTVAFLLAIIAIFAVGIGIACYETQISVDNYNGGVCSECGGEYRFSSAEHYKNSGDLYYYTCEDCGHTVTTFSIQK